MEYIGDQPIDKFNTHLTINISTRKNTNKKRKKTK